MAGKYILVVDDEEDLLELVKYNLSKEGYRVTCLMSGKQALLEVREALPDLIVLDVMLPLINGLEICRLLKQDPKTKNIPIIMLTAKSAESDVVTGLELGADDYITKPFSLRLLCARIKALLRPKSVGPVESIKTVQIGEMTIDAVARKVIVAGEPLALTNTEFRLISFLASKPGWAFLRSQIVEAVKGEDYPATERSVDVQVAGLRKKLGAFGDYIETVRGVGYRFKENPV
jgi:two-component system phosphate regulon response regulator PhoB